MGVVGYQGTEVMFPRTPDKTVPLLACALWSKAAAHRCCEDAASMCVCVSDEPHTPLCPSPRDAPGPTGKLLPACPPRRRKPLCPAVVQSLGEGRRSQLCLPTPRPEEAFLSVLIESSL